MTPLLHKLQVLLLAAVLPLFVFTTVLPQSISDDPLNLLSDADLAGATVYSVQREDDVIHVCLDMANSSLAAPDFAGLEEVILAVRYALTPLEWRVLDIQAYDTAAQRCVDIADWVPVRATAFEARPIPAITTATASAVTGQGALTGKTVYISAGHGWIWNDYTNTWRTQRGVYQGFIEDHNNAEAVDQYLIRYLENAGATVIPVRERDWNEGSAISDNDNPASIFTTTGQWSLSGGVGYAGGTYLFSETTTGAATAQATWTLNAPVKANYAVYAWVKSSLNRAPDAHYTITHAGGMTEVTLDQRIRPETWRYLGTYPVGNTGITVVLDNHASVNGAAVIADAIRLGGGTFTELSQLSCATDDTTPPSTGPNKPWWESATYYYSQAMGFPVGDCSYASFNDVIARPIYSRWMHSGSGDDAVYISWHTNGYRGETRGTESYVYEGSVTYGRTEGSLELQAAVHDELIHDIRVGWDPAWIDRGKKQADLGEVRMLWDADPATRMPGVLLEIAFHDQPDDAQALLNPRFNQLSARAVYQGIVKYFEGRDGYNLTMLPEPPTHVRAQNLGGNVVRVSWHASPTDALNLVGDAATSYRVYTSPDGFAWGAPRTTSATAVDLSYPEGQTVYFKVAGVNSGGESLPSEVMGVRVGQANMLIVSAYDKLNRFGTVVEIDPEMGANQRMFIEQMNAYDYVADHGNVIPAVFGGWDSASNESIVAGEVVLGHYQAVDWILGEESTEINGTLDATERSLVQAYLNQGGGLVISGSELGWDLVEINNNPAWLSSVLKTAYVADSAGTYLVQPVSGGVFDGLSMMSFDEPSAYLVDFADVFAPTNGGVSAMTYVGGTGGSAVIVYDGASRIVNMGFPIEALRQSSRIDVMTAIMNFLLPGGGTWVDTHIDSPIDGSAFASTPAFNGTASGSTPPAQVLVSVRRESDQLYWSGSVWGSGTWLNASGVTVWSYPLPALADGVYTLSAKAVLSTGESDESPDQVTLTVDTVAPDSLEGLIPPHAAWISTTFPVLSWNALAEPVLRYDIEADQILRTSVTNTYTQYFGPGIHVWRVRAVDAAGNIGAWSLYQAFVVDVEQLFMPAVIRD